MTGAEEATLLRKAKKLAKARLARQRHVRLTNRANLKCPNGPSSVVPSISEPPIYRGPTSDPILDILNYKIHKSTNFSRRLPCECDGCSEFELIRLKADNLWRKQKFDEAIELGHVPRPACRRWLTLELPPIPHVRANKSKGLNWLSPIEKKLKGTEMEDLFGSKSPAAQLTKSQIKFFDENRTAGDEIEKRSRNLGSSDWTAEVVAVITSSPSSGANAFHNSCRLRHLLDIRGADYFLITTDSEKGSPAYKLLANWRVQNFIFGDPKKSLGRLGGDAAAPQLLIDGVVVGDTQDLQDLIEENDIDYIMARKACPNCLYARPAASSQCNACGVVFRELVNTSALSSEEYEMLVAENRNNSGKVGTPGPDTFSNYCVRLGLPMDDGMFVTSAKLKRTAAASIGFSMQMLGPDENETLPEKTVPKPADPNKVAKKLMQKHSRRLYQI